MWTTGERRQTLTSRDTAVRAVRFSPDAQTLATGGADTTALLWPAALPDTDDAIDPIRRALHRECTQEERSQYLQGMPADPVCP